MTYPENNPIEKIYNQSADNRNYYFFPFNCIYQIQNVLSYYKIRQNPVFSKFLSDSNFYYFTARVDD